jgi:cytochrome c oxidase subunit 4
MASPRTIHLRTFAALLVLTATTFGLSFVALGVFQVPVALAIAAAKACLVVLFFMHLVDQARVNAAVLLLAVLLVALFVGLTAADVATRQPGSTVAGIDSAEAVGPEAVP